MLSRWSIRSLVNVEGKTSQCQTSASRSLHTPLPLPDFESTNQNLSSLAGQGQASTPFEVPSHGAPILISNLNRTSNTPVIKSTHETHDNSNPAPNPFQSFKRLTSRIRNKLFSSSRKMASKPSSPVVLRTQVRANPSEVVNEVDIGVLSAEASRSTATLVPTISLDDQPCTIRSVDQAVPTSSQTTHDTTPCPSSFARKTGRKSAPSPIDSNPSGVRGSWYSFSASGPPTSTTTSTNESNFGERALWRQWAKSLDSKSNRVVRCDEHKTIATGTALYDWDGVIPGRQTRGICLQEGQHVPICNVINDDWLHAHVNDEECMYLPRIFVRICRFDDDRGKRLLGKYLEAPKTPIALRFSFSGEPASTSRIAKLRRRARKAGGNEDRVSAKPRPEVPPAPFPREPNDMDHQGNRVMVDTECKYPRGSNGVIITFTFTLVPALHSRLTSLWFSVKLPGGQKIVGIYPEHVVGQQTDVQHNASRSKELALKASASHAGVGVDIGYGESRVQELEYSRTVKAEIRGAGKNSNNASWTASEDVAARCGLENKMKFSIMLQTKAPPAKLSCQYTFGFEKETSLETNHRSRGSFDHSWEVSFLSGSPTSTASERSQPRRKVPFFA